jgi:RNA-binding protein NOB1
MSDLINSKTKTKHLVVDTGAFLANSSLHEMAEKIYTVPEVLTEVKSRSALDRLQVLPYEIEVREPEEEDRKVVKAFARKTGDLGSLSNTDLEVLALAVFLERRQNGGSVEHLNKHPKRMQFVGKKATVPGTSGASDKAESSVDQSIREEEEEAEEWQSIKPNSQTTKQTAQMHSQTKTNVTDIVSEVLHAKVSRSDGEDDEQEECDEPEVAAEQTEEASEEDEPSDHDGHEEFFDDEETSDDDANEVKEQSEGTKSDRQTIDGSQTVKEEQAIESSEVKVDKPRNNKKEKNPIGFGFGGDWITPSNLEQVRRQMHGVQLDEHKPIVKKALPVAVISNDFSLQNVGLQLGLKLLSVERGLLIRRSRQSALRCIACFAVTMTSTRMFCPQCGNLKTLKKVTVSVDSKGQRRLHLNPRRPETSRDKKLCIPRPRRGKHALNPILAPDQHVPKIKPSKSALADRKAVAQSVLNDDGYLIRDNPFAVNDVYSSASRHLRTGCRAASINQMVFNEGRKHANRCKDKRRN